MLKNTEWFFINAKQFQDKRGKIMEDYEANREMLARFEGSKGHAEDLKKLDEKLEQDLTALRDEYRPTFLAIFGGMTDAIGRRSIDAPTADQLNLLTVLRMKRKVTTEDCERVAQAVKDNPIALDVVQEIAQEKGIRPVFSSLCSEMSTDSARKIVDRMKSEVADFLLYDTDYSARRAKEIHDRLYGDDGRQPRKADTFDTMEGCYQKFAGVTGQELKKFAAIVDKI